jgi:hypothetical protein
MVPNIKDRSGESFNGNIIQHGPGYIATSDRGVAIASGSISPEGPCQGDAHVPGHSSGTEVAIVESSLEPCTAEVADAGGTLVEGHKSVGKCASVATHPELMSSHRRGSITAKDHDSLHTCEADEITMPMPAAKVEKTAFGPVTFHGGRQPFSNTSVRTAHAPMIPVTRGVSASAGNRLEAKRPAVYFVPTERL